MTNNQAKYRIHNVKFTNKASPRPVTARTVQGQHQIDLMDLGKEAVNHNGHMYKYVLSVMDIFSRYLWLRRLEKSQATMLVRHFRGFTASMVHLIASKLTEEQNSKGG